MAMWSRILNRFPTKPSGVVPPFTADRVKAFIIDIFLLTVFQIPVFAFAFSIMDNSKPFGQLLFFIGYVVLPLLYFVFFWRCKLQTPGKKLMGMIVVDEISHGRLSSSQAALRACMYLLLPISLLRLLVNSKRFLLHDEISNSKVLYRR